ncbi:hypothetical protein AVEN_436-1 [Araneus ventricosus]|uniref:Uncharacterized protein n=1 Tax=Araneus ventricosus TaxID=182803 RepID=A0A4Y2IWE1_ARAVE|nr:hypothetical protein AVEN_436-1 [Araneus ventricosus]
MWIWYTLNVLSGVKRLYNVPTFQHGNSETLHPRFDAPVNQHREPTGITSGIKRQQAYVLHAHAHTPGSPPRVKVTHNPSLGPSETKKRWSNLEKIQLARDLRAILPLGQ